MKFNCMHNIYIICDTEVVIRDLPGSDRMVVGFTTTYAISAYHHWSRSGRGVHHYVIQFVSDLRQAIVFSGYSGFLHQ